MRGAVAFESLSARYSNGEISISWKFPPQAPDTVYILPIYSVGHTRRAGVAEMSEHLLRDVVSGTRFKYAVKSPCDVTRCEFLVFLGNSDESRPDFSKLIENPAFTVKTTVGHATVYYDIKSKKAENNFAKHIISLHSSYTLEEGILGYTFTTAGQRFSAPFPGAVKRGKRKYPPFFTKTGEDVTVEVVGDANADVAAIRRK
jgi:hypothetical protein